jgi:hypothetical protein
MTKLAELREEIDSFNRLANDFDGRLYSGNLVFGPGSELTVMVRYQRNLLDFLTVLGNVANGSAAEEVLVPGYLLLSEVDELLEVVTSELVALDELAGPIYHYDFRQLGDTWGFGSQLTPEMLVNQVLERELSLEEAVVLSRESIELLKRIWTPHTDGLEDALAELAVLELQLVLR